MKFDYKLTITNIFTIVFNQWVLISLAQGIQLLRVLAITKWTPI